MSKSTKMFVLGVAVGVVAYHVYAGGMTKQNASSG